MSDRQWAVLDGEPDIVLSKGKTYQEIGEAIARATATLERIVDDTAVTAKSMDATRTLASDVLEDVRKTVGRYSAAGSALETYASPLESAVSDSATAATQIASIEQELAAARMSHWNAQSERTFLPVGASADYEQDARTAEQEAAQRVSELETSLATWQQKWLDARDAKNAAAVTAGGAFDEVFSQDRVNDLEDSRSERFWHGVSSVLEVVKMVCDIAGILAIFLSWVPVLGQILLVMAAIGSVLAIVGSIIQFAKGEIGWGGLLLGVGLGVIGLFGGKLAGKLTKVAKARAVTKAASHTNSPARLATRLAGNVDDGARMITEARTTVANADNILSLKSVLKSPFQRSDAMADLFELRKAGGLTVGQGLAGASRQAFVFSLKNPFGGSSELLRNPALFHHADGLVGAAVTMNLVSFGTGAYRSASGFASAMAGDNGWNQFNAGVGVGGQVIDGSYKDILQLPGKIVGWGESIDAMI